MIVIDGDSVAHAPADERFRERWPGVLAQATGQKVVTLATHKAVSRDCVSRMWKAASLQPKWYLLCVGQWAHNHEPVEEFEANIRKVIEFMRRQYVGVVLMDYPVDVWTLGEKMVGHHDVMRGMATVYATGYVDLRHVGLHEDRLAYFDDHETVRCHFNQAGAQKVVAMLEEFLTFTPEYAR